MGITKTDTTHTETHYHIRSVEFTGAEPMPTHGFSHKGKQYLPTTAVARWNHGTPIKSIKVMGNLLKKDGTESKQGVEMSYTTPEGANMTTGWRVPAPAWVLALFADAPYTTSESDQ